MYNCHNSTFFLTDDDCSTVPYSQGKEEEKDVHVFLLQLLLVTFYLLVDLTWAELSWVKFLTNFHILSFSPAFDSPHSTLYSIYINSHSTFYTLHSTWITDSSSPNPKSKGKKSSSSNSPLAAHVFLIHLTLVSAPIGIGIGLGLGRQQNSKSNPSLKSNSQQRHFCYHCHCHSQCPCFLVFIFIIFWMVDHEYCLRWKFLSAKSFKSEKLQVNRIARLKR